MKICFLVELPHGFWQWDDGLRGAMRILEDKYEVKYHLDGVCDCPTYPDVVFAWGGTLATTYQNAQEMPCKRVLLFAGGDRSPELFNNFNFVCFENESHTLEARSKGVRCVTAFGTDTTVFKPIKNPKVFDTIYPAAFGLWKRKDLFAEAVKDMSALTIGNIQVHEPQCMDVCVDNGVAVSGDIPQSRLPYFYGMSCTATVIPVSFIGGQRTVLEALACKLPVIVPSDAPLVTEFKHVTIVEPTPLSIRDGILSQLDTVNEEGYAWVHENMTQEHYAKKLENVLSNL